MAENPPLNRIYVLGYSANDRDYPIVSLNADPRVAGYRVPEDLSVCPDKRYPNHVFTGAQPLSGDERVRHVWEILPSPWVPFTRYDDDLGPVQGRRRSVKNGGQVASLETDKRVTYEAREGSAIVYTELEETWSIKTDEDGNSLFPIRDRDFYDASRGPVQERRQLFVPTGDEIGSLENINGVITQTSYEPYNEFLSVKIVQTYKVNGPQLISRATDNDGQLVTVTTQRKGADGYVPPSPTATRTVEASREDAESLVERIVDTPEVFKANTFSVERPDPIPQKFRVAVPIQSSQEIVEGTAEIPTLEEGEISKSEEQRNKFIKRISSTSRDQTVLPQTLTGKTTNNERQEVTVTETLQLGDTTEAPTATKTVESEALGDGNYVVTKTEVEKVFGAEVYRKTKDDLTPQKFRGAQEESTTEENIEGTASNNITLAAGEFAKSEQQINNFVKRVSTTSREIQNITTLNERVLTPEGLLGTRILTLASGDQTFTPSATLIDANVESLGDGRTVKTEITIPEIFTGKTVIKNKTDLTPEKFKAKEEEETTEENIIGSVGQSVVLSDGEFRKTEQQITKFVKRVSTTKRSIDSATDLTEEILTPQGQLAIRTLRLATESQSIQPDAKLIDGSIEALGDGRTIKTEVRVPFVFSQKSFSIERSESIPQKFRASIPLKTKQETIEGQAGEPSLLDAGEVAKSETQQTEFTKRTTISSRDQAELPKSLNQRATTQDLQLATITETLQNGDSAERPSATVTIQSEALGDGNYVITKTEVEKIFGAEIYRKTKDDLTPQKFKAAQEESTTEENIEGTASNNITLAAGEFAKSEQQINKFVKRISTTSRTTNTNTSLSESVLTPEGIRATRILTLSNGQQDFTPSATLIDASVESLGDGRTVKTETTIPDIFEAKTVSIERPDPIPTKFRALVPIKTNQSSIVGSVDQSISLNEGEVAKSETQQTKFVKRISSTSRDQSSLPKTLTQKTTSEDGQVATITETLQSGDTPELPSATKTIESEAVGDGTYIVRKTEVPKVFSAKTLSIERPDPVPQKFRVLAPSITEQETVAGDAVQPVLISGELAKSEQQVNTFVKRTSKTSRDATQLPKSVTQKSTTNEGVLATVVETLQSGDTTDQPTATKTVESEALGDGTYIVRTTEAEVFDGQTFSVERPDVVPAKFRSALQTKTDQKTVEGQVEVPSLENSGELSKSEQQITKFLKRTSVTSRDANQLPKQFTQKTTDNDRQIVTITETLQTVDAVEQPSATVTIQSEAIGDSLFVVTKSEVPEVFSAKNFQVTRADLTPQKFRASQEDITEEETVTGEASPNITLDENEFSKSEQQVNKFVKRISKTKRNTKTSNDLTEFVLTPDGQIGTRKLTLSNTTQTLSPSAKVVDGSVESLGDGRTVKTETTVPSVFAGKTITKTRIDLTPDKFKAKSEDTTTEENVEGQVDQNISLTEGEFRKSEQQITQFVKRRTTTERATETTESLEEKIVTPQGQQATRKLTLASGMQEIQLDEKTLEASVEALGDNRTVKTVVRLDGNIFDGKTETRRQVIRVPDKFISKIDESSEVVASQTATPDDLGSDGSGVIESSAQRLTEFTVRKNKTTQETNSEEVKEGQTNNAKQAVNVTSSIVDSGEISSTDIKSTTEFIRTQSIGGGRFVKEVGEVDKIFEQKSFSQETPDPAPQKFRVELPTITEERNEEKTEITENDADLIDGEIAKTVQQIDAHTARIRTVKRDAAQDAQLEGGKIFTTELNGGVAEVVEEYHSGPKEPEIELGIVSYESEALGDNKFVTRTVKIAEPKKLKGTIYDEQFDVQIPFSRTIVAAEDLDTTDSSETTPRDPVQSVKTTYNKDEIAASLIQKKFVVGDIVNISLPDTLESIKIIIDTAEDSNETDSEGTGNTVTVSGKIGIDIDADFLATIKSGYSGPAQAQRHFFFLPETACSINDILTATGAASIWPTFKPQPVSFSLKLRQTSEQATVQVSLPNNQAKTVETEESVKIRVINIPPTLHSNITIETPNFIQTKNKFVIVNIPNQEQVSQLIKAKANMETEGKILATEPAGITGEMCLYSVSASPYKYGLVRVEAVTVDLSLYV